MKRAAASDTLRPMRRALFALTLLACGPLGGPSSGPSTTVEGTVIYDSRQATAEGVSEEIETRPARFVDVQVLNASGELVGSGRCDENGRFAVEASSGAATLRVLARVRVRGHDVAVTSDAMGQNTHAMDVPLSEGAMAVHAVDSAGDAGAFHIVDTLVRGLDAVKEWTGQSLPPLFAFWMRGVTSDWSFYRGERPEGSGRFALELLGGDPGEASISDTDEHDEAIVLHELGHFVMDRLTSNSSTGGMHPRGAHLDPGVAWEEGRASWFALAVLGAPFYRDTIGVEPWGRLRVDENLESQEDPVAGPASETSVSKILWDLTDGEAGAADEDEDGVSLGPAVVLEAMMAHAREPGAFPSLGSFLAHLVREGRLPRETLRGMLERTGEPAERLLPEGEGDAWPIPLTLGETVHDRVDGQTDPAPSGGRQLRVTGYDANRTYRVHVERAGMLVARLEIEGSGLPEDSNLDLELRDLQAEELAASRTLSSRETVARLVEPGWYILKVRDGGGSQSEGPPARGNRAAYTLSVAIESL